MDFLGAIMQRAMDFVYGVTGNYGLVIILLTGFIRVLLLPFTLAQTRSSQKMQELQPIISKLQKEYKNDPTRLNQETMALWKKNGVNPLSSCLLLLVQFPFIIAFFQALQSYEPLKTATFIGFELGKPDPWILPILAGITTYFQVKVSSPPNNAQSQTMLVVFPLLIGWMSRTFAAALSLYWVVSNLFSIGERYLVPKTGVAKGESTGR